MDFDVIVIGSGFGGAITSCRLAEKGKKVLVLERGKKWDRTTYPRELEDEWIWSHADPEHYHGWTDLRRFKGMAVIAGAGVGGGSLIYANVSAVPPESVFASGWPPEITFAGLQSYYATVADILDIHEVPQNQWSPRVHLMKEAADKLGQSQRFGPAKLAVSFDNDLVYDFDTEPDLKNSKRFINKHGVEQGTCAHLGECDIGCRADAKNTLDKNYLHIAEKNGAEIRPLHLVTKIEAIASGYRVYHGEFKNGGSIPSSTTAERVILAAGSMGSNKYFGALLNRVRKQPSESHLLEGFNMKSLLQHLTLFAANFDVFKHIMPWFAQGVDAGDGELSLTNGTLDLKWDIARSLALFETIEKRHHTLAEATDGHPFPLPTWALSHELITPHPLGGCNMAATPNDGVVNHEGEVFGYKNLYVADGAIIPRPLGVNPSRTISALAERIADRMRV